MDKNVLILAWEWEKSVECASRTMRLREISWWLPQSQVHRGSLRTVNHQHQLGGLVPGKQKKIHLIVFLTEMSEWWNNVNSRSWGNRARMQMSTTWEFQMIRFSLHNMMKLCSCNELVLLTFGNNYGPTSFKLVSMYLSMKYGWWLNKSNLYYNLIITWTKDSKVDWFRKL